MTACTSAFCVVERSKFLRSLVLGLRAFLLGVTFVFGDGPGFGLCGPADLAAWSLGNCTFLLHLALSVCSRRFCFAFSSLPWALLSTAQVVSCVQRRRPATHASSSCGTSPELCSPVRALIAALSGVSQPHRHSWAWLLPLSFSRLRTLCVWSLVLCPQSFSSSPLAACGMLLF